MAERIFTAEDQRRFAHWSGDRNPIHLDEVEARRTVAGASVAHGIHLLLWAVDCERLPEGPFGLRCDFRKFVYPGQQVRIDRAQDHVIKLVTDHGVAASIRLRAAKQSSEILDHLPEVPASDAPASPSFAEMQHASGWLSPCCRNATDLYPSLSERLGQQRVAALGQLSRLVGMVCPGLHSVFAGIDLDFDEEVRGRGGIGFRTFSADERFQLIKMRVGGSGIQGTVEAFIRPTPAEALSMDQARQRIAEGRFAGRRALIVGGSRGVGAVTAKLLAAGRAEVTITFATGAEEAKAICDEVPRCSAIAMDVREPIGPQLAALERGPTHVYYFATPRIFAQKQASFDEALLERFRRFYVSGFEELCTHLAALTDAPINIFYPSSIALTETPKGMEEYARAKAEGELLCADLMRRHPNVRIAIERLPRLDTDQTRTIQAVPAASAAETMLTVLERELSAGSPPPATHP